MNGQKANHCGEVLKIVGRKKLFGSLHVDVSKNAFLPVLAGCLLCKGEVEFDEYVALSDLESMRKILEELQIFTRVSGRKLFVDATCSQMKKISHVHTSELRASIILLGAMLGRFREAVIAYPGGCKIGARPIDIHINALKSLGAEIEERHGYVYANGKNLHSGEVFLPFPSVGATESLMLCASLLEGVTILKNVAKEPEIVALQDFLTAMGGKIFGAGSDEITIYGVKSLHGGKFHVMSDRIVAGTFLIATAITGGDVTLENAIPEHNESLLSFLRQSACKIDIKGCKIRLRSEGRLKSISKIETLPYPNFPTDLQSQMMVLQAVCDGVCVMHENLFENRFGIVDELHKMGAKISVKDRVACIVGVERLFGADVFATDLRAGAGLVLAGLGAEGYTTVHNLQHIDRGYFHLEETFSKLGAEIKRI